MSRSDFEKLYQQWKKRHNQHGRQAFSRYIMLIFLDGLQQASDEFVFKGGNLLWHYIKTPRETVDLDISTLTLDSHERVKELFEKSFEFHEEVTFRLIEFLEINKDDVKAASVTIGFKTISGQKNQFDIDVVYSLPSDLSQVMSTTGGHTYKAVSIENIIADKLSACHKFGSGNTRMKDYDDLWRLSQSDKSIDFKKLNEILKTRGIPQKLDEKWIDNLSDQWSRHQKSYKDLPKQLDVLFQDVNAWFELLFR